MNEGIRRNQETHLQCFDLAVLRAELLAPHSLSLSKGLHAGFELVDLLPAEIELLAHVVQLVAVPLLRLLHALLELGLDLAERLEARDEVVVEDAEVREGLGLGLPVLLLLDVES